MQFNMRSWLFGLAAGLAVAALIAAVPTAADWSLNPGGIFQGQDGTDWPVLLDTFLSWLAPAALLVSPFTVLAFAWLAGRRGGNTDCPDCR